MNIILVINLFRNSTISKCFLFIFFLLILLSCALKNQEKILLKQLEPDDRVEEVVLLDGTRIIINSPEEFFYYDDNTPKNLLSSIRNIKLKKNSFIYHGKDTTFSIGIDEILYLKKVKTNVLATTYFNTLLFTPCLAYATIIVYLIINPPHSCPLVYSFNNNKFVLDAEPLGGAIHNKLERTEISKLEFLSGHDSKLKLLITGQSGETEYINRLRLLYVEHNKNTLTASDINGRIFCFTNILAPLAAIDKSGRNILSFIESKDNLIYYDHNYINSDKKDNIFNTIDIKFIKPKSNKTAILFRGGTTYYGSKFFKDLIELYGNEFESLFNEIDRNYKIPKELVDIAINNELYFLNVSVKKKGSWIKSGIVRFEGPICYEDQVIPIDLSGIESDTVEIRINPPYFFWGIDFIGIVKDYYELNDIKEVQSVIGDEFNNNISKSLKETDYNYCILKSDKDLLLLDYLFPNVMPNNEISFFLETTGYYDLKTNKSKPKQSDIINNLHKDHSIINKIIRENFSEWLSLLRN